MIRWEQHARQLAGDVAASGATNDHRWIRALEDTPRHVFVPRFYEQQPDGDWAENAADTPGWLEAVYRNEPLTTHLADTPTGGKVSVSSSTKPGLMARMLDALAVHDEHRVCEIGTGTGYNAALLSHRLGDDRVFSLDIGTELVDAARQRLSTLGYAPTLIARDGARGMPEHGPFDRIIATCSVPAIPEDWIHQVRDGGLILTDLKPTVHAGNLVLLQRTGDQLQGRFFAQWAGFMAMRPTDTAPNSDGLRYINDDDGARSTTQLEPFPWAMLIPWFLAQSRVREPVQFGLRNITDSGPEWTHIETESGSWARVRVHSDGDTRDVVQAGPTRLWDALEDTHRQWAELGSPDWSRLGLTVTADGDHVVWLDAPDSGTSWSLASYARV